MLTPIPYHQKVKDHFKTQAKTWEYFATVKTKENQLRQFKTELLKNTYKFDPAADAHIYEKVNIAKEKLSLQTLPVTIYQAQYTDELNASIIYLEGEAHIVSAVLLHDYWMNRNYWPLSPMSLRILNYIPCWKESSKLPIALSLLLPIIITQKPPTMKQPGCSVYIQKYFATVAH